MPHTLTAIDGTSFVLSDRSGNMTGGVHGLYVRDCRYLSHWELRLGGSKPKLLSSHHVDFFSSPCFLASGPAPPTPPNAVSLLLRRVVGNGMEEEWEIVNHEHRTLTVPVSLLVAADFLDLFDVKAREFAAIEDQVFTEGAGRSPVRRKTGRGDAPVLTFSRTDGNYQGRAEVSASPPPDEVRAGVLSWRLKLKAHETQRIKLTVGLKVQRQ